MSLSAERDFMVFLINKRQGRKEIAAWKKEPPQPNTKLLAGAIPPKGDIPTSHWLGIYGGGIQSSNKACKEGDPPSSPELFGASVL